MSFWTTVHDKTKAALMKFSGKVTVWYKTKGKPFLKTLATTLWGQLMSTYQEDVLRIVADIAKNGVPKGDRAEVFKRYLIELVDNNKDGHIHADDIDQNTIDLLRSSAVAFMRTLGSTEAEQVVNLEKYLNE